jgi:hypothetical protein
MIAQPCVGGPAGRPCGAATSSFSREVMMLAARVSVNASARLSSSRAYDVLKTTGQQKIRQETICETC